ncbi:peptidoglycan binding domain-containing protein [Colletotrichum sojae]|uniref:Peptidoglycan binding domain-containing protein n=1 Tax=Colletotrichum sojae TaxID=2175907 RepID=A0A8H6N0L6_9PEZI|nr:peptidoglycan binding domain-containing protein [Colletotrichum sojae]
MSPSSTNSSLLWRSFTQGSPYDTTELDFKVDKLQVDHDTLGECQTYRPVVEDTFKDIIEDAEKPWSPRPKRIILCCDGTWQSSVTGRKNIPSNVTRLARSVALTGQDNDENPCDQIVFYSAGVGTGGGVNVLERGRQATFGDGLVAAVIEAYNFVVMNYAPHDQIFCFGFSRGAYTARSVAGLINDIGIIQPKEMDDFPDLYALYRKHAHDDSFNFRQSKEYRQWITGIREKGFENLQSTEDVDDHWLQVPHNLPPEFSRVIEAVGVFDTVGALGVPGFEGVVNQVARMAPFLGVDDVGFHNPSLSRYINHAYHAMALDEHRAPFTPTLWRLPLKGEQCPGCHKESAKDLAEEVRRLLKVKAKSPTKAQDKEKELSKAWKAMIDKEMFDQLHRKGSGEPIMPQLKQVWFPGGHINIGGGNPGILYGFPFDFEQLSLISFTWMCDQIKSHIELDDGTVDSHGNTTLSTLADREIAARKKLIHNARHESKFGINWAMQYVWWGLDYTGIYKAVTETNVTDQDDAWATGPIVDAMGPLMAVVPMLSKTRTPGEFKKDKAGNDCGQTNEMVHPAVHFRVANHPTYRPKSLANFMRSKKIETKGSETRTFYEWKKGDVVIPEYVMTEKDNISRRLAEVSRGRGFVDALVENGKPQLDAPIVY